MKWAQIRDLYLGTVGSSPAGGSEAFLHLSEAKRQVYARLEVQEIEETDIETLTVAGQDYVEKPSDLEWILTLVNVQTGEKLQAEPTGMRGRMLYCEPGTGKPAEALPQWWVVSNNRIWLRPTPDEAYPIKILGKRHAVEVTRDDLNNEPEIPADYHMALVFAAAASFLRLHPDVSKALSDGYVKTDLETQLENILTNKKLPKEEEAHDKRDRFFLRNFMSFSRRGGGAGG